ncbi:MAG: DUF3313 family protein [Planctomycetota bacterium JB042]
MRVSFLSLLAPLVVSTAVGCKTDPTWNAGFVEDPRILVEDPSLPFHRSYVAPDFDPARYREILVKPVTTRLLRSVNGWDAATLEFDRSEAVRRMARTTRATLQAAFAADPDRTLRPTPRQSDQALVLEFALVELRPTKSWLNVLGYLVTRLSFDKGIVAMEARLHDGGTGELLMAFADREAGKATFLSVDDLTWYGHAESIVEDWAAQLVEVVKRKPNAVVEDSSTFTLWPF